MNYYFVLFVAAISFTTIAQVEDESCLPPAKKIVKKIELARKSQDPKTVVNLLNMAIAAAPDNAMAYYEYGMYAHAAGVKYYEEQPKPTLGDRSFLKAEEMFLKAVENCSDYHANCSYFLGVINYTQGEMEEATKWFEVFQNYKHQDNERFPDDYSKKLNDVKEVLLELNKETELRANQVPFEPKIVRNVSSKKDEYFPMISPDNALLFYTRKLDRANLGDLRSNVVEEFTFSQREDMQGLFSSGEPLKAPFNTGEFTNYGSATLSVDNKEMIICACKKELVFAQEYLNCDLYSTKYERSGSGGNDFSWTPLENLGTGINTKDGWEAQPSLSADGNTLFYTVARPTSRDNDIFIAKRNPDGSWGDARPFDEINTAGKDKSPFLHQDSETLYFVSTSTDERKGFGGLDIFYMREENGKWSAPKNIGSPINSKEDELGLFVSMDGQLAYFSSRVGGDWNIYSFELYEEARPKNVVMVKGELTDELGAPVKDAAIEIAYSGSDVVERVKVNGDDGKYAAIVKVRPDQDVLVTVKKENHAFDSKLISREELGNKTNSTFQQTNLQVKEIKIGEAYTIQDILYATNSNELSESSKFILKGFASFLQENKTISIRIQGHTDDIGDEGRNLILSENRAKSVRDYLISIGIDAKRLKAKGFGESLPKVTNDSDENRAVNRRTDFVIEAM